MNGQPAYIWVASDVINVSTLSSVFVDMVKLKAIVEGGRETYKPEGYK